MRLPILPSTASRNAAAMVIASAALLLAGCSDRENHSKSDDRAPAATNSAEAEKGAQTNTAAGRREVIDAEVFGTGDTNAAAVRNKGFEWIEPALNLKQIAELKPKAEQGDAESQYKLAQTYDRGEGGAASETESLRWITRAAESGHAEAAYDLAFAYRYGFRFGVETNASLALRWLRIAAERGQTSAQHSLANSYRAYYFVDPNSPVVVSSDWGTGKDLAEAAKWFRKAAEQGDASAQSDLGEMYLRGEGVPTNTTEGVNLMKQAINKWEKEARERLASTNFTHLPAEERQKFAEVVAVNPARSCVRLAQYFYEGKLLPIGILVRDVTNAVYWYEKAATMPDNYYSKEAQFQLGYIHATWTENYAEAVKWFRKRAEDGDITAQCNLALLYYKGGVGVARDWKEAAKWFRAAGNQDNPGAQYNLGRMYRDGEGVPRDYGEAVKWFRKAAEQGHAGAQNDLGVAYARGEGFPRDYVEAYKWYNVAAASGEDGEQRETSRKNLDGLSRNMTRDQIAEAQQRSSAFVPRRATSSSPAIRWEDFHPVPESPRATGTAFFIIEDGYLLTSAHVVSPREPKNADEFLDARPVTRIEVTVAGKSYSAKLVKADKANDVAVLKIAGNFKALPLAPSRAVKLGETICTIGFPNTDIQGTEPKFTTGEINSLAGIQDDSRHFQISVPVQPGNSGGPLLDSSGNVIGIVSARLADIATLKITGSLPQNVNYALKSSFVFAFLETLPDVPPKLKSPRPVKARSLAEIADEAKSSVALVTVY